MRVFFATDIHGSEICWRKFLNAGAHYKADVLVLGGDMTGKALVPIIDDGDGHWHATLLENRSELEGEEQIVAFEDAVMRRGYYSFRTTPELLRGLEADESHWHGLFQEKMLETVETWMRLADERLAGTGIRVFCCPGNDDQFEIDEIIENAKTVELAEGSRDRDRRLPTRLDRLGEPHAVAHLPRGGRAGSACARRAGDRTGDRAGRADGVQLPLPSVPLGPRRRARADR
jgi:Icc-related predicted phosphoesterase